MCFISIQMTRKMDDFYQVLTVERLMSMQGDGQVILMIQNLHMTKQNASSSFLDKSVSHAIGNHYFLQWSKLNSSNTFLDKVTASDIAFTILVYESTKEVWEEDLQIKASFRTNEERRKAMHYKKTKYHVGRGKHLKRFGDGWTNNREVYYQEMLRIFKELKSSEAWNTLQDRWTLYQKKHYARDDNQVEELREPEEKCEASDKDDWQIDMPDGDEIGDIEEASVYADSPRPRNGQRLSC
jgi:hypothetical protein